MRYVLLVMQAFWELLRHDAINGALGFGWATRQVARLRVSSRTAQPGVETMICQAISLAACLYWKRALCLQRSVVTARLLRKHGIDGRLVIGYCPSPFVSHAWVEVDGRAVNDSPIYKERMYILYRV